MRLLTFHDLFLTHLYEISVVERQLLMALPSISEKVINSDLKELFSQHSLETESQINRLDQIYFILDLIVHHPPSLVMSYYLTEVEQILQLNSPSILTDSALIFVAQKFVHYEIALYATLWAFAKHLDYDGVAELLSQSLAEEEYGARRLLQLAEGGYFYADVCKEMDTVKIF